MKYCDIIKFNITLKIFYPQQDVKKMRKSVFNTVSISPACAYCQHGKPSPDGETVLCVKKGVVAKDYKCRKYKYDIMKRVPRRAPELQQFDEDDFKL